MVCVIGGLGSMGRRYRAILKWLGLPHVFFDNGFMSPFIGINSFIEMTRPTSFIVATPTETHADVYRDIKEYGLPILMEKPFSTNIDEVEEICSYEGFLSIVMQYQYLDSTHNGESFYNYYNHGKDGLVWDCFQVIALARGLVNLYDDSPVWTCRLNGIDLKLSDMDEAYVKTIRDFLNLKSNFTRKQIIEMHKKVQGFEDENKKCLNSGPSPIYFDQVPT